MNPIARIAPVTDEEAVRMARPDTVSDLGRQIAATPIATGKGSRRLLLGVPLAAGLVAAALIMAGGAPSAGHDRTETPAASTAYIVKHVDGALDAAEPGVIAQMTITTTGAAAGTTTADEWSYGDQWRAVMYSSTGEIRYDEGYSAASAYTLVSYEARMWARQRGLGPAARSAPGTRGCGSMVDTLPLLFQPGVPAGGAGPSWQPATVARDLRTAISCGSLTVAGRQSVDGIDAIKLTNSPGAISETIWVSPATYLPARVIVRTVLGNLVQQQTADITWLPLTAQNLAKLTVSIPTGFREVPLVKAARPLMERIPG